MSETRKATSPFRLFVCAALVASLSTFVAAKDACKPKIDKKNLMIELTIDGFTNGRKLVFIVPANGKKNVAGKGAGVLLTQPGRPAADFSYSLGVSEEREGGAVVELSVVATAAGGAVRTTRRSVFIPYEEIVEQMYLGGVNMKAYFKMKPVSCYNIHGQ